LTFGTTFIWIPGASSAAIGTAFLFGRYSVGDGTALLFTQSGKFEMWSPGGSAHYLFTLPAWSAGDQLEIAVLYDATAGVGNKLKMWVTDCRLIGNYQHRQLLGIVHGLLQVR